MRASARKLKFLLRFYPPFFFQRIVVKEIAPDFRSMKVVIKQSFLTRNLAGTTFGGTIFAATDPLYALLLSASLEKRGVQTVVWLKHAKIDYLKPASTTLFIDISLPETVIEHAKETILRGEKFVRSFEIEVVNESGETCARVENQVYVRLQKSGKAKRS